MTVLMTPLYLFDILVLGLAAAAALRLALKPPVRREASEHPWVTAILLAGGLVSAMVMLWLISLWPPVLHGLAMLAAVTGLFFWWRGRSAYGQGRNWPPGSLALGKSLDAIEDRRFYANQAAGHGPVFKMSQFGRPVVCILGLDRGQRLLRDHRDSLAGATLPLNRLIPDGYLRYMHAETHKALAPLFRATFSTVALEQFEEGVRACFRQTLRRMATESAESQGGVYPLPWLQHAVVFSTSWLLYGLKPESPQAHTLVQLLRLLDPGSAGYFWRRRMLRTLADIDAVMQQAHDAWDGRERVPPSALKSMLDAVPEAIGNPTYTWNFAVISRIAYGDVAGLCYWIFKMCCDHPKVLDAVRGEQLTGTPPASASRPNRPSAALCVVMETLRMEQSEYLYRKVAQDFDFEGYRIPKGWFVRLLIQESHRDPAVFEQADRFMPNRFMERSFSRSEYSPFGSDAHGCMGFRMAQFMGEILVSELAAYDIDVVSDGRIWRKNRHRHHWRPSSGLRVRMTSHDDQASNKRANTCSR